MASRGTRDRMVVTTKVGRHPDHRAGGPVDLVAAVDDSLGRLGIDRIDLLYFHGDDLDLPLEERLGAVDALIAAGKVRAIGASDFSPERLIEARVLAANGLPRFEALTTRYNLLERRPFEGAPELVAHAQGLSVLPYFALANGFLGGGVRRRSDARHDARGARQAAHLGRRGHRVLAALDAVAFAHGVQPATIALAWLAREAHGRGTGRERDAARSGRGAHERGRCRAPALRTRRTRPRLGLTPRLTPRRRGGAYLACVRRVA